MASQVRLRSTPFDAAHLQANAMQRQAVGVISGGFCVCASPFFVAKDGCVDTNQLKLNSGKATNDLLPVQNDPAALGFRACALMRG